MKSKKHRMFKIECIINENECLFFSHYIKIFPGIIHVYLFNRFILDLKGYKKLKE